MACHLVSWKSYVCLEERSLFGSELLIVLPSCLCPELFLSHLKPCLTYFLFMALGLDGVCLRALQLPLIQTTALWGFVLFFLCQERVSLCFPGCPGTLSTWMASDAQKSACFCLPRTGLKVSSSTTTQLFVCLFLRPGFTK